MKLKLRGSGNRKDTVERIDGQKAGRLTGVTREGQEESSV